MGVDLWSIGGKILLWIFFAVSTGGYMLTAKKKDEQKITPYNNMPMFIAGVVLHFLGTVMATADVMAAIPIVLILTGQGLAFAGVGKSYVPEIDTPRMINMLMSMFFNTMLSGILWAKKHPIDND